MKNGDWMKPRRKSKKKKRTMDTGKPADVRMADDTYSARRFDYGGIPDRNVKKNLGC